MFYFSSNSGSSIINSSSSWNILPFGQLNIPLKMPQKCRLDTLSRSKSIVDAYFFNRGSSRNSSSSSNVLLLVVTVVAAVIIVVAAGTFCLLIN